MGPLESLKALESVWRREPVMDHDDTPVSTDHLKDRGFVLVEDDHGGL